ncbi:MAG TPA: prenyltransferase/squalene oxidase repeat-containing protein [Planctomycetota bacterium]|nr:prenyltransferase/squalene oxidase repeat-containing protein [Planctomycetota bacterium]
MLQVARLAPKLLQEAAEPVVGFLKEQFNDDGGARDRAGKSDLYYTVFALEGLMALQQELPVDRVQGYLSRFGGGDGLDFVHLTCLARCWAALGKGALTEDVSGPLALRILQGGNDSVYHQFLKFGALEDLGAATDDPGAATAQILELQSPDGSFMGTTPTTAGAVTLLHHLGSDVPRNAIDWLYGRARPQGGFFPAPDSPVPDLLSTATALHALTAAHAPLGALRDPMLDFVDTLWTGKGFCGSWADDAVDSEYTYYALLSLGHLSLS